LLRVRWIFERNYVSQELVTINYSYEESMGRFIEKPLSGQSLECRGVPGIVPFGGFILYNSRLDMMKMCGYCIVDVLMVGGRVQQTELFHYLSGYFILIQQYQNLVLILIALCINSIDGSFVGEYNK
jgi:hypothetical protein